METENEYLERLLELEALAEKKARIYSRLLVEPALAKKMDELASQHEQRKQSIYKILYGKAKKKGGTSLLNEDKTEL